MEKPQEVKNEEKNSEVDKFLDKSVQKKKVKFAPETQDNQEQDEDELAGYDQSHQINHDDYPEELDEERNQEYYEEDDESHDGSSQFEDASAADEDDDDLFGVEQDDQESIRKYMREHLELQTPAQKMLLLCTQLTSVELRSYLRSMR